MKRMITPFALLFALVIGTQVSAQQQTVAASNSQAYNVYYAQDVPYVESTASNQKMDELDQYYKQYAAAYQKQQTAVLSDLKAKIDGWKVENQSWIDALEEYEIQKINQWLDLSSKSLRLYDQK